MHMRRGRSGSRLLLFSVLFLISGAAGLVYEIVWERLLQLYFGVTLMSVTLIVAAYMAGLGLGSLVGGRAAPRLKSPLVVYGSIELGVGLFGFASPMLITEVGRRTAGSPYVLVFLLSFLLLLVPTFLMGATLPILSQSFVDRVDRAGSVIGLLYGINTLGAVLGAVVAGYVLIGAYGFDGATSIACLLNSIAGLVAILWGRRRPHPARDHAAGESRKPRAGQAIAWTYRTILASAFLIGFIHLGFEMLWFRLLGVINKTTAYSFPTILAVFLLGLAIGAAIWGRKVDQAKDPVRLFWTIELWVGLLALSSYLVAWMALHADWLQPWIQMGFNTNQQPSSAFIKTASGMLFSRKALVSGMLRYLAPILLMVFPGSLAMGAGLPILDRISINRPDVSGRRVGDIHLANIVGSVVGTLTVSFIFLPLIGTEVTFKILAALCATFLLADLWIRGRNTWRPRAVIQSAALVLLIVLLPRRAGFFQEYFTVGSARPAITTESGDAVLALALSPSNGTPTGLWIGGVQNSYFPSDGGYERSVLACASVSQPRRILIIGFGGGNSAYFASMLPGVEEITIVELMEDLAPFLKQHVPSAAAVLNSERVHYVTDDGRRYLYANPLELYDLIFIDPLYSFTTGHNNLYSREAMELYRQHLAAGGVFCPWVNEGRILPATAASVFPYVDYFGEFVVARDQPIRYDAQYMLAASQAYIDGAGSAANPDIVQAIESTEILRRFRSDEAGIRSHAADAPYLTDTRPWLEYYLFRAPLPFILKDSEASTIFTRVTGCDGQCSP